ncbi:unnamed protein product [Angiostrongylus costaricensis]|uniref:Protein-tyrosine-phosphatase n=1 Tax=Angiostrongylus costaricensis TaxID=334426 RepID=A0A0R3PRR5_ANGCS|nr:unnamed protein product [Angiostrongylus costaricensis]
MEVLPQEKSNTLCAISEVLPYLYVASYRCITESKLKQFQITHVIDISNIGLNEKFPGIEYKVFNVDDNNIANISKYFEEACEFIDAARDKGGKTVIYCAAGISRSATLAIMYLVIKGGRSLRDSYYHVNQVRPIISPNIGFWRQMIDFEKHMTGKSTVTLITGRMPRPLPDVYLHRSASQNT